MKNWMNFNKLTFIAFVFIIISGCSSDSYNESEMNFKESMDTEYAVPEMESMNNDLSTGLSDEMGNSQISNQNYLEYMKYVLVYNYELETLGFDKSEQLLTDLVNEYDGYFQEANVSGRPINYNTNSRRRGEFIVRIPVENIDMFLSGLDSVGNELNRRISKTDVSNEYYDMEARIETLEIREENLLDMLKNSKDLEFMIELEKELADVRYEIERYTSDFRNLENRISYSTVNLTLTEVYEVTVIEQEKPSFLSRISKGFKQSIESVVTFFEELFVFLIGSSPVLLLWIIFLYIAYKIVKKVRQVKGINKIKETKNKKEVKDQKVKDQKTKD